MLNEDLAKAVLMPTHSAHREMGTQEQRIYDLLQDDLSRRVFMAHSRNASTIERLYGKGYYAGWFKDIDNQDFCEVFEEYSNTQRLSIQILKRILCGKKYVIYGAGVFGKFAIMAMETFCYKDNCISVWDRNTMLIGTLLNEIAIELPPDDLSGFKNCVLVAVKDKFSEISEQLKRKGLNADLLIDFNQFAGDNSEEEAFDKDIILSRLVKDEIFLDGGCCDFGSSLTFLRHCPNAKKIYVLEPDAKLFSDCKNTINELGLKNVHLEQTALWSHNTTLSFEGTADGSSHVSEDSSTVKVSAKSFDSVVPEDEHITFIKLDIEGSELEALHGCEKIIMRDKPKLAIIVHNTYDYINIPEYILSLVSEYKIYLRHYQTNDGGTCVYAVI